MERKPFRPVDVLRRLEAVYLAKAEAGNGAFEAFSSLGCESGRIGDPDAMFAVIETILGSNPFAVPNCNIRLKLSAKALKPITVEVQSPPGDPLPDPALAEVVQGLGGTMAVSQGALGRTVRLTLPWAEADIAADAADAAPQDEAESLEGMRILIADDSPTNRLVLEEMLADTRAKLVSVQDGKQAVDSWHANDFDLLLLDISMPVMDGVTAIREIRAAELKRGMPPTAAIAVTANALVNQVADYLVAGFDTHLAKPFRRKDLMHAILTLRK